MTNWAREIPDYYQKCNKRKPDRELEAVIWSRLDPSKSIWALWQPEEDAFLNARGDLISMDEIVNWREIPTERAEG